MIGKIPSKPIANIAAKEYKWKVKVVVLDKTDVRTNAKGRRTQKVLLQDKQGTVIELILWNQQIDVLQNMLHPTRTYEVAGAKVQDINPEYIHMSPGQHLEWVMIQSASVDLVTDESEIIPCPPLQPTSLSLISQLVGNKTPVDVLGVVVSMDGPKEARTETKNTLFQEIVLIDKSLTPKMLTMWGHFLTHQALDIADRLRNYPIILCRRLVVNNYADGSLSTTPFCYMTVDPETPETKDMRAWFDANKEMVLQHATGESETMETSQSLKIEGKMSIADLQQDINFCQCETCFKSIMKDANQEFNCRKCNMTKKAIAKCKVQVNIDGDTGKVVATMYDDNAEQLLGVKAEETHEMQQQDINKLLLEINQKLQSKIVIAFLKTSTKSFALEEPRYTIQQWSACDGDRDNTLPEKRTSRQLTDTPEKNESKRVRQGSIAMSSSTEIQQSEKDQAPLTPKQLRKVKLEHGKKN